MLFGILYFLLWLKLNEYSQQKICLFNKHMFQTYVSKPIVYFYLYLVLLPVSLLFLINWWALQWWNFVVTVASPLLSPTCTLASSATLVEWGSPQSKPSSTASTWTGTSVRTAGTGTQRAQSCLGATTTMSTTGFSLRRLKTWRSEVSQLLGVDHKHRFWQIKYRYLEINQNPYYWQSISIFAIDTSLLFILAPDINFSAFYYKVAKYSKRVPSVCFQSN